MVNGLKRNKTAQLSLYILTVTITTHSLYSYVTSLCCCWEQNTYSSEKSITFHYVTWMISLTYCGRFYLSDGHVNLGAVQSTNESGGIFTTNSLIFSSGLMSAAAHPFSLIFHFQLSKANEKLFDILIVSSQVVKTTVFCIFFAQTHFKSNTYVHQINIKYLQRNYYGQWWLCQQLSSTPCDGQDNNWSKLVDTLGTAFWKQ